MELTYGQLIKQNRNFRNLLWGQFISELGNWFNFMAGFGLVRMITGSSAEAIGILMLVRTLPWAILMPFAGAVADRISRKKLMIITDLIRVGFSLLFLTVSKPEDLWIVYVSTFLMSSSAAFFDGAKNAATPNIAGKNGLLSGTALMFSTRFLLMAVGSAAGSLAALFFGYKVAFIINSISFLISAISIWMIPEESMQEESTKTREKEPFLTELREGFNYTLTNRFALTVLLMNIIWATGGGAINVVFEGFGTKFFAPNFGFNPDYVLGVLMTANGIGLTIGTLLAHRVGSFVEIRKITNPFIGWSLIFHGIIFAVAGLMPNIWLMSALIIVSRILVAAEYSVQETIFQRYLPDYIRGRISTLDRGAEITMFSISGYFTGLGLTYFSPQIIMLISGLLAGSSGIIWLWREKSEDRLTGESPKEQAV